MMLLMKMLMISGKMSILLLLLMMMMMYGVHCAFVTDIVVDDVEMCVDVGVVVYDDIGDDDVGDDDQ